MVLLVTMFFFFTGIAFFQQHIPAPRCIFIAIGRENAWQHLKLLGCFKQALFPQSWLSRFGAYPSYSWRFYGRDDDKPTATGVPYFWTNTLEDWSVCVPVKMLLCFLCLDIRQSPQKTIPKGTELPWRFQTLRWIEICSYQSHQSLMFCQLHIRQQDHSSPKQLVCILEYTRFFSANTPKR